MKRKMQIFMAVFLSFAAMLALASTTTIFGVFGWLFVWFFSILGVVTIGISTRETIEKFKESIEKIKVVWDK